MIRYKLKDLSLSKLEYGSGAAACMYDGITRYVRITDIDDEGNLGADVVSPNLVDEKYLLYDGDVLFARTGATVGKTYLYKQKDGKCIFAGFLIRVVPNQELIRPEYLYYYTKSPQYKAFVQSSMKVVAQPNINAKQYGNLELNVPSLEEQDIVIGKLSAINSIITLRQDEIRKLDKLIKARFVEMFGDFKINPMGWPIVGFEEIATIDGNMTTDYEKYADYPHIGIDSIEKETGLLKGYRTVAEDGVISGKYVFTPAHIIYSKIRPNLNKVALPDFEGLCSADAYPILPLEGKCNRVFLAYDMRSRFFLDYILQFCNRTNLPKVNRKEVAGFKTPLPPLELQNEFAAFVAQVDKSKAVIQKSLEEAQLLFDSLMQQYFG